MRPSARALSVVLLLAWAGVLLRASAAGEPKDRMTPGHCGCVENKACWHFLRSPLRPPEDPCRCGLCASKGDCSSMPRPEGWSGECMGSQKPACFWKRHAASWGITCAACAADTECPACDAVDPYDADVRAKLAKQSGIEGDFAKHRVLVGWSKHFYYSTDIQHWKLLTQGGAPRVADQHELVHLFLERAEKAYDDFVAAFGDEVSLGQPLGIFMAEKNGKRDSWQAAYFGSANTNMQYGGAPGKVAGGFCWNGFAVSTGDAGNDRDMHAHVRHMIGHILFSCWHGVAPFVKNCPKWAFDAAGDWLCKSDPLFADYTVWCHDEGKGAEASGKDWDQKARLIAANKHEPIEKLFVVPSLSHLTVDDVIRSWSYMDVMLREDRDRWLATLKIIREGNEPAVAFQKGLGMSPDEFDRRWVERMTGKRKSMSDTAKEAATPDADGPTAAMRRRIREEPDPVIAAALIRGLEKVADVKTAEAVLSRLATDSDLVRETIVILLSKTQTPEVVECLRTEGLSHRDSMVRAFVARILGNLKDAAARPALEALLADPHWLARANAATALAAIADPASLGPLVAAVDDASPKAWIAKADAVATYGASASKATVPVAKRLDAPDWQVRLTACRALAKMGDKDAVDGLIQRLETEGGRLRKEILTALRAVTHENFGDSAPTWRKWWKEQKPQGIPPEFVAPHNPEDDRYAKPKPIRPDEPTYYGRRIFSQSVLFVIDVSLSMNTFIRIPPEAEDKLGKLAPGPRISVAKEAVSVAISKLDPRARFNVVFFSTTVQPWQKTLVTASEGAKAQALSAIKAVPLEDETNIYGALRAAVGLLDKPTETAELDPIPDTIYFLTDGTPTRGEITDPDTILSWMRDVNRFAKVELHVIAMGDLGVDVAFLERLATENGGEFIHISEGEPEKK